MAILLRTHFFFLKEGLENGIIDTSTAQNPTPKEWSKLRLSINSEQTPAFRPERAEELIFG